MIAGAIIASRPSGYVVYPGYAQPVYGPGCYWASQPVYDGSGRVVGYTGQPVQVCPAMFHHRRPAMLDLRRQLHRRRNNQLTGCPFLERKAPLERGKDYPGRKSR